MISQQQLEAYCLAKAGTEKTFPFGDDVVVIKVMGKLFALWGVDDDPVEVNLKCDPDWSLLLRDSYLAIVSGYHMSKKHWNTITLDGSVPADLVWELVDHSYTRVVEKLRKAEKEKLAKLAQLKERTG